MVRPALQRLGPYRLTRNLTRPGRAEVYVGRYVGGGEASVNAPELPERALVKVLRPPEKVEQAHKARPQEALARFVEEGRLSTRLRHPAVVKTYGVGFDKGQNLHFIVQEYAEGVSFAQLLAHLAGQETPLPYGLLLQLTIPILRALHHAHHDALREDGRPLRIVHRDIKPANVMLTYDGRVLLMDLAAARSTSFTRQDTVQDVLIGTAHYLAPEQVFNPELVGHGTDIFSSAVILFELATLHPLLPRTRRLSEVALALTRFNLDEHLAKVDEGRYPGLREVLARGMAPDPKVRYETAGQMARELEGLMLHAENEVTGLGAFAAQMRRLWEGDGAEGATTGEVGGPAPAGGAGAEAGRALRRTQPGDPMTNLASAPVSAPVDEVADDEDDAVDRVPIVSVDTTPGEARRWVDIVVAALIGFLVAALTLYFLLI